MKLVLDPGDTIGECPHASDVAGDLDVHFLHCRSGAVYWTAAGGKRERIPCSWILACRDCFLAAGGNPKQITMLTRPSPWNGARLEFDDTDLTPPLDQLPDEQILVYADLLDDDLSELAPHDRRRILSRLVAQEFEDEPDALLEAWCLATDGLCTQLRLEAHAAVPPPPTVVVTPDPVSAFVVDGWLVVAGEPTSSTRPFRVLAAVPAAGYVGRVEIRGRTRSENELAVVIDIQADDEGLYRLDPEDEQPLLGPTLRVTVSPERTTLIGTLA
jgi:hypothetical protein